MNPSNNAKTTQHYPKLRNGKSKEIKECAVCLGKYLRCNMSQYHVVPLQYIMLMKKKKKQDDDEKDEQCGPVNNTILTCKSCKKLCDDNCKKFKAQLCAKYKIANVRTRQQFIKARTGANAMMDEKLRYRLP